MRTLSLSCLAVMLIAACPAYASNPCQTLICMAGKLEGQNGGAACNGPIADYFNIIEYGKHWRFNPSGTAAARLSFLNSCGSSSSEWPAKINAVYGAILL